MATVTENEDRLAREHEEWQEPLRTDIAIETIAVLLFGMLAIIWLIAKIAG
jgi:hypothetical protein